MSAPFVVREQLQTGPTAASVVETPDPRVQGERQLTEQANRVVGSAAGQSGNPPAQPTDLPTGESEPWTNSRSE